VLSSLGCTTPRRGMLRLSIYSFRYYMIRDQLMQHCNIGGIVGTDVISHFERLELELLLTVKCFLRGT